jgi:hypothetical protein
MSILKLKVKKRKGRRSSEYNLAVLTNLQGSQLSKV